MIKIMKGVVMKMMVANDVDMNAKIMPIKPGLLTVTNCIFSVNKQTENVVEHGARIIHGNVTPITLQITSANVMTTTGGQGLGDNAVKISAPRRMDATKRSAP